MNIHLLANLIVVVAAGILIGITTFAVRLLIATQSEKMDAFVEAVLQGEPAAKQHFENINRQYRARFNVEMRIEPPSKIEPDSFGERFKNRMERFKQYGKGPLNKEGDSVPSNVPQPNAQSIDFFWGGSSGIIRIGRSGNDFKSYLFAANLVFQFVWGFPATFVLFALVGLTLVFLVSLFISPLGLNLVDFVILPATIIACHLALSRHRRRSDPMWGW